MNTLRALQFKIFLVVASYWIVSISLVFVNKLVLSDLELDLPIFVTWFQCIVTVMMSFLAGFLVNRCYKSFEVYKPSTVIHIELLNVTTIFMGMIIFNNVTLKMVPVSFYNIARALTTIFNLIFTRVILKRSVSLRSVLCCGLVVFGFILGLADVNRDSISFVPVLIGVLSSVFVSLFSIYTQQALDLVDRNPWLLQTMVNINSVFLMMPLLPITGETSIIFNQFRNIMSGKVFLCLFISGILGFLIGIFTNLQIKYTSALTHNISGTSKSCVQTLVAVIINHEWYHSVSWWIGSILVLVGSGLYSYVRNQEMAHSLSNHIRAKD